MTLVATQGLWLPNPPLFLNNPAFSTGLLIDATGELVAFVGRVWNKDRASKDITKVGFRFGTGICLDQYRADPQQLADTLAVNIFWNAAQHFTASIALS